MLDTSVLPPEFLTGMRWMLCTNTLVNQTFLQCNKKKKANYASVCPLGFKDVSRNSPRYCYPSLCPHPEHLSVGLCNLQVPPVHPQHLPVSQDGNLALCRALKKKKKQVMGSSPGELQKVYLEKIIMAEEFVE